MCGSDIGTRAPGRTEILFCVTPRNPRCELKRAFTSPGDNRKENKNTTQAQR